MYQYLISYQFLRISLQNHRFQGGFFEKSTISSSIQLNGSIESVDLLQGGAASSELIEVSSIHGKFKKRPAFASPHTHTHTAPDDLGKSDRMLNPLALTESQSSRTGVVWILSNSLHIFP